MYSSDHLPGTSYFLSAYILNLNQSSNVLKFIYFAESELFNVPVLFFSFIFTTHRRESLEAVKHLIDILILYVFLQCILFRGKISGTVFVEAKLTSPSCRMDRERPQHLGISVFSAHIHFKHKLVDRKHNRKMWGRRKA